MARLLSAGSSPQARGTPTRAEFCAIACRFIPAGAGNTASRLARASRLAVHPRRRGEHIFPVSLRMWPAGSSPQARGTPGRQGRCPGHSRFIPAGAGNTFMTLPIISASAVHPRRRGEHRDKAVKRQLLTGSSPQARGTLMLCGSRPVRGRFIPAGAGNTPAQLVFRLRRPVHPRRRGEHPSLPYEADGPSGSSPQARGTLRGRT